MRLDRPLIIFDVETTGLDTHKDNIVQLAALKLRRNEPCEILNLLINPLIAISKDAAEVHGITANDVKDKPTFKELSEKIYKFFKSCDVCGYNLMRFDIPLLWRQLKVSGHTLPIPTVVDIYKIFVKDYPKTLENAHYHYVGGTFENAHDALADVKATTAIMYKMLFSDHLPNTISGLAEMSLDEGQLDLAGKLRQTDKGVVLTFGKYKNCLLSEVPQAYFKWCLKEGVLENDALEIINNAIN